MDCFVKWLCVFFYLFVILFGFVGEFIWICWWIYLDLSVNFYRTQVSLGSDLWVRLSLSTRPCWNFTDVTLADDRAFHGNVAITFGTNASDVTWWANFEQKCIFEWNMILRNTGNLKLTNTRISQSRFSGQREQTLSTGVLILISSWKGWTCSCTPLAAMKLI